MAEGFLKHYGGENVEVNSAGTHPSEMWDLVIELMKEVGIDVSNQRSKHLNEFLGQHFDVVITVCDSVKENCPVFPGTVQTIHRAFRDPEDPLDEGEQVEDVVRNVRDEIRDWVISLLQDLSLAR